MKKNTKRKAFTIVELVIVIAVIGILATVLVPSFGDVINNAKDGAAKQEAKNAYTTYIIEQNGTAAEYMVYDAGGRFVALHNGAVVGVYGRKEDAIKAMLDNPDMSKLTAAAGGKLFAYDAEPTSGGNGNQDSDAPADWSGRSAVFVGDSITAGVGTTKLYYQFLDEKLDFDSVTAMGVGGSCISAYSNYGTERQPLINRYQNIPSTDLIVIFIGTNDYGHETPLGTTEDTGDGTFYGALNTIVPALVAKHTSSKIVFVTSLHRYGVGTSGILGTKFTYDYLPNGVGATLEDYVNAVKTVCANNGVSVIDLYTECTLDPSDKTVRDTYMPDGIHPNAAGHEVVAGIIESHILGYEPIEDEPIILPEMIKGNKFASTADQPCRASSRLNYYLKAGTVITLKDPTAMQWACAKTSDEYSNNNLGYFPEKQWTDAVTAVVAKDGWIGFAFKYRDETQSFDLTRPLSDYITIEEPHTHTYESGICTGCGKAQ